MLTASLMAGGSTQMWLRALDGTFLPSPSAAVGLRSGLKGKPLPLVISLRNNGVLTSVLFPPVKTHALSEETELGVIHAFTLPAQLCSWDRVCCGLMHLKSTTAGQCVLTQFR